jgi:sugar lactone lactonase YvrE
MVTDRRPGAGSLYRLDPDGSVHTVLRGVTISNGLDWSPDGVLAYYNDTETYRGRCVRR